MSSFSKQSGLLVLLLVCAMAHAADQAPKVRWERETALAASNDPDVPRLRRQLSALSRSGDGIAAVNFLQQLQNSDELNAPARERLVFEYVQELRQEPPGSVSPDVIDYLKHYPVTVMVEHHDHPHADEALFNITSATYGVVNHWSRQEAAFEGAALLAADPQSLVRVFLESDDPPRRRGYIDALATATDVQLRSLNSRAIDLIEQSPDIVPLSGHAAILARDLDSLEQLARNAGGPGLNEVFRAASQTLEPAQRERLLNAALDSAHPENAALAIAYFGPGLAGTDRTRDLLIERLSDAELGAAAALALSHGASAPVRGLLNEIAGREGEGLAGSRARLALQLIEEFDEQEAPR